MKIEVSKLSAQYAVRKLNEADAETVLGLELTNPLYFEHCPPPPDIQGVLSDMKALPPNKTPEDKYYIGFFEEDVPVAIMDLILHYTEEDMAFIGLFMVLSDKQGGGVGTGIISECLSELSKNGFASARLGYMKGNPQSRAFWLKNKFHPTGTETNNGQGTVVVMERKLYERGNN